MKKKIILLTSIIMLMFAGSSQIVCATESNEILKGKIYNLGEKDAYEINKAVEMSESASRFYLSGDIAEVSVKNEIASYAVESGNIKIMVDQNYGSNLFNADKEEEWHIVNDKSKVVDSTKLEGKIATGAIIVQTSRDGKTWINVDTETDIYNKMSNINKRVINEEEVDAFYETTNVQITAGCYYRIIVAYKLKRAVEPSKILFVNVKNTEEKEQLEIYEFYAYNPNVNQTEELDVRSSYEFSDVSRVDSQDGFENPKAISSDDPHNDWTLGKFYVSGYTDVIDDEGVPVFLKVPGDKAALWFLLEQELNKCNGRKEVRVASITSGSDIYFGTPTIDNFGKGALIVRKTDKNNKKERYIYTNYLEASATVGANTRVDLFEEGDYEVALDYQLNYDKPFVFGTTTDKTLTYRVYFEFKVRNGDISVFLRDISTDQFITNANVAEEGFYIDVANSQYLNLSIKREVLSESLDGLVEDTKFSGVAKEGRHYTEEGIYTVVVKNLATGDTVEKKVYVGDSDVLKAHMVTGVAISEINERVAAGAYIDEQGQIIDPVPEQIVDETSDEQEEIVKEPETVVHEEAKVSPEEKAEESVAEIVTEEQVVNQTNNYVWIVVAVAIILVIGVSLGLNRKKRQSVEKEETE